MSTGILGRRTAPSSPFRIPNRGPRGFYPKILVLKRVLGRAMMPQYAAGLRRKCASSTTTVSQGAASAPGPAPKMLGELKHHVERGAVGGHSGVCDSMSSHWRFTMHNISCEFGLEDISISQ